VSRSILLVAWASMAGPLIGAEDAASKPTGPPLAIVAGSPISEAEIEELLGPRLAELRQREYQLRAEALDEAIAEHLVSREAALRGLAVPALIKAEIDDKSAPTPAEVADYYAANKSRFEGRTEAEAKAQIETGLRQQKRRERQAAYVHELRVKAGVKVLLEPLRVTVDAGTRAPTLGPEGAPVTILEFSDFQCPFCARAQPVLHKVRETYGDRVRFVFLDFPLPMHAQAPKAHEAAACAAEEGRFWPMHDQIFANQAHLEPPDLKRYAAELGLDPTLFADCLDSGRHANDRARDMEEGARQGVGATPAFFINGRLLVGAQPFEAFAQVIDDELERADVKARPPG
jgi:protein-disulfide isomerase